MHLPLWMHYIYFNIEANNRGGNMKHKLDELNNNYELKHKETGKVINSPTSEIVNSIDREIYKNKCAIFYYKLNNKPHTLTLSEIEEFKKSETVILKGDNELKSYVRIYKINKPFLLSLDDDVLGCITRLSLSANRDGVLRTKNNRIISSFNKLRLDLGYTSHKWNRIKKILISNEIVVYGEFDKHKFLVLNPIYSNTHSEIDSFKFIAFHVSLKKYLSDIDYWYLVNKLEINLSDENK